MPDADEIAQQQELLTVYRRNLAHLQVQAAQHGGANFSPTSLINGIYEVRDNIKRIKLTLRTWGVPAEDLVGDEPEPETGLQGNVSVSAEGRIYGTAVGVNSGEIIFNVSSPSIQIDDEQRQQIRELLRTHTSRLRVLELQQAAQGLQTPPQVITEIAEIQTKIARLNTELTIATPGIDRVKLRHLKGKAFVAFHRKDWVTAENLFSQLLAAEPEDEDIWSKLNISQRHLNTAALYQAILELRDEDQWQAVIDALDDLNSQYSGASDPENIRDWAEKRRRQDNYYSNAIKARDNRDWRAVLKYLDDLSREHLDYEDTEGLISWAEEQQRTERYSAVLSALETILNQDPENSIAKEFIERLNPK